ncbi:SCO4225 family membrane protein [Streptomyces europaeiscabiei]|uniref:SCO4225 family membrane protein n=1 Tax=Streptomyces europaeiscabiei TaxID=146819 RepID=UPI0038F79C10
MTASSRSLSRTLRRHLLNPAALGYLALVVAVGVWVGVDSLFVEHADAGFAGVWLFLVTAPTSLLFVALPGGLPFLGIVLGAVIQAFVLGAAYRWVVERPTEKVNLGNA